MRRFLPFVFTAVFCFSTVHAESSKPNIIIVLADDLGYGDLSCYGQSSLSTPNLDRMAAEGLKFTRAYAGSTVCAPSRCVLMTGKHTGHASVRGNSSGVMRDEELTIAELLRDAGYATGCVGKWGIGNPPPLHDPERNGFQYFYGYVNMFHAHNFFPEFIVRNGEKVKLQNVLNDEWKNKPIDTAREGRGVAKIKAEYVPDLVTSEALSFVQRHKDHPFFLYYALNVPHANNEGGKNGMEVPTLGKFASKSWPEPEKGFAQMMSNIDRDMGRLFDKLKSLGLDEKTVVFFTSDNGPHQEGGHKMEFFDSNGDLLGMKRDLYEGGVRVPMIARWPKQIAAGKTTDHVCAFQDFLPTLAELSGARPDASQTIDCDGISFLPTLRGDSVNQKRHAHLYWEFQEKGGRQAVLKDNWKAVRLNWKKNPNGPLQLFHLETDPDESDDVAAEHPDLIAEMKQIMSAEHSE